MDWSRDGDDRPPARTWYEARVWRAIPVGAATYRFASAQESIDSKRGVSKEAGKVELQKPGRSLKHVNHDACAAKRLFALNQQTI